MKIKCTICNHEQDVTNELMFLGKNCELCDFTFYPEQKDVHYQIEKNDHFLISKAVNHLSYPVLDKSGFAKYMVKYDKFGRVIERSSYDLRDNLKCDEDGIALFRYSYDLNGKLKEIKFYNDFKQVTDNKDQIYKITFHFDHLDRLIKKVYKSKNPFKPNAIYTIQYKIFEYNENNKVILIRTVNNKKRIISEIHFEYNDNGFIVNVFGDNNGTLYKKAERIYDKDSNIIQKQFFKPNNTPIIYNNNSSYVRYEYDTYGNILKELYYSLNHALTEYMEYMYNSDQKIVSMSEFKLCKHNNNVISKISSTLYLYDDKGLLISKKLSVNTTEICLTAYKYDENRNLIEKRYYDHNSKLMNHRNKDYAIVKYQYDQFGNIITKKRYDKDNCIINLYNNIAYSESTFNEFREVIMIKNFDNTNQLCSDDNNTAIIRYEYDDKGRLCSEMYYNHRNQLVNNLQGIAFCKYEYKNNEQSKQNFSKDFKSK